MKKILLASIVFGLFLCASSFNLYASEEKPIGEDLSQLIDIAKKENPDLKSLQSKVAAMEARIVQEKSLDDPTFKIELEDLNKNSFNISPSRSMLTKYTISQMFPFFGKLKLKGEMASAEAKASAEESKDRELEITAMVKSMYYELYFVTQSILITSGLKDLVSEMEKIASVKYQTGRVSQQDIIKAQVELSMFANELITLNSEKRIVKAKLNTILNRPPDALLSEPKRIKKDKIELKLEDLTEKAIKQNPMLRAALYEIEANQAGYKLAKKTYLPDFMIGYAPIQRGREYSAYDLMFGFNIPIWIGKNQGKIKEAFAKLESARSKLASLKNSIKYEIEQGIIKIDTASRIIDLYKTSLVPQAELSFKSAIVGYETGKVDFLSLLETERVLKDTKIKYIKAVTDYQIRVAELERFVGEEFK